MYVLPCVILFLCVFSPFSIAITSLEEERANLSAFRTLGVWEGLRFVIVSLHGIFSYFLCSLQHNIQAIANFYNG